MEAASPYTLASQAVAHVCGFLESIIAERRSGNVADGGLPDVETVLGKMLLARSGTVVIPKQSHGAQENVYRRASFNRVVNARRIQRSL